MAKPTRFYVEYEDAALVAKVRQREAEGKLFDLSDMIAEIDGFDTLDEAVEAMTAVARRERGYACVVERQHLRDETGPALPSWTFWDSDDEVVRET